MPKYKMTGPTSLGLDNKGYESDSTVANGHAVGKVTNGGLTDPEKAGNGKFTDDDKDPDVDIEEDEDPWKVDFVSKDYTPWQDLNSKEKTLRMVSYIVKSVLALGCLYMFICSLDFLSSAFKLLGGEAAGKVFQQSDILTNPIAGLMMGVLVTVLVQSSSTSTSIVVSMVGAKILDIKTAIPIILGANIGTSVTNTIVAIGQISDRNEFRRAFAGATVHDMFNWLAVIVFLPIEVATNYLYHLSGLVVDAMHLATNEGADQDILKVITEPFTKLIIQVNKDAIKDLATNTAGDDYRIMKLCCDKTTPVECCTAGVEDLREEPEFSWWNTQEEYTPTQMDSVCPRIRGCVERDISTSPASGNCSSAWALEVVEEKTYALNCSIFGDVPAGNVEVCRQSSASQFVHASEATSVDYENACLQLNNTSNISFTMETCMEESSWYELKTENKTINTWSCDAWAEHVEMKDCNNPCDYLFKDLHSSMSDEAVGAILLIISLLILCMCLVGIVKLLHSLLKGPMAMLIKKFINADFPGPLKYLTGYVAILVGAGLTIIVQSSSIFTSTLTPLVGIGVIELDRMFPLTLGSNIGTTTTAILSALANSGDDLKNSLQVAFCHLFFNISGILLFYPISFLRFPIPMAKFLGTRTADYRWFALVYILFMYFLLPAMVFALSVPGWFVLAGILGPVVILFILVGIVKVIQAKNPECLPKKLRNWKWLPEALRSLKPYDKYMRKIFFCKRFDVKSNKETMMANENSSTNL